MVPFVHSGVAPRGANAHLSRVPLPRTMTDLALERSDAPSPDSARLSRRELLLIVAFWSIFAVLSIAGRIFDRGGGEGSQIAGVALVSQMTSTPRARSRGMWRWNAVSVPSAVYCRRFTS